MVRGKRRAVVSGPWRVALTVVAFEYLLLSPPPSLPGDAVGGLPAASPLAKTGVGHGGRSSQPLSPLIGYPLQSSSPSPDP